MHAILLLEDEPCLMVLLRAILRRNGYVIWEAANTEDAISRFREAKGQIDLLLADVTLPSVSGIQAAILLRAESPGLSVILTSGYPYASWSARDTADSERLGSDSVIVLQKPFEAQTLLNSVRKLTGGRTVVAGAG